MVCLSLLMYNPHRPDEHEVSVLQRLEGAGEYVLLQSPIKTRYWTDALQQPTMSCQVRPSLLSYVCVVFDSHRGDKFGCEYIYSVILVLP